MGIQRNKPATVLLKVKAIVEEKGKYRMVALGLTAVKYDVICKNLLV